MLLISTILPFLTLISFLSVIFAINITNGVKYITTGFTMLSFFFSLILFFCNMLDNNIIFIDIMP